MNRELVLQELSDEQLELVTGGDGGVTIIVNIYYITQNISINNSVLINSYVGNSVLIGSSADSFNRNSYRGDSYSQSFGDWDRRHRR